MRTSSATTEASSHSVGTFEVGDCIRVDRPDSAPWYGVIRWIGTLPGTSAAPLAGMEMVSTMHYIYSMYIWYSASTQSCPCPQLGSIL